MHLGAGGGLDGVVGDETSGVGAGDRTWTEEYLPWKGWWPLGMGVEGVGNREEIWEREGWNVRGRNEEGLCRFGTG
eukprot:CAMPEP_0184675844 /NCGR_PEP_ID=MMETSP0308-20130426/88027_1 /TAXON_ID=38269 /ORGANISM="Gloeochaete witrockiana, Strain SAG 46.84" /LENGTH=75 /DNA_ID=CAMNT_0027123621 /DNA_START=2269 /DNA_END=2493 /DNA_ORIENTATION=+